MDKQPDRRIMDFLLVHRLCVIATSMPNGTPHMATMHYSMDRNSICLYLSTDDRTIKVRNAIQNSRAAVAIGWSEVDWITVQMRGNVVVLREPNLLARVKRIHYSIHPNSLRFEQDPHTAFLAFTPDWIRFSDLGAVPEEIIQWPQVQ